jgi:hypothetical protein
VLVKEVLMLSTLRHISNITVQATRVPSPQELALLSSLMEEQTIFQAHMTVT